MPKSDTEKTPLPAFEVNFKKHLYWVVIPVFLLVFALFFFGTKGDILKSLTIAVSPAVFLWALFRAKMERAKTQAGQKVLYYVLASATKPLPFAGGFQWPYEIAMAFAGTRHPLGMTEGVGHGSAGTYLTVTEALDLKWSAHFENADASWLLPFVQRMAAGERVQAEEVIAIYRDRTGSEPRTFN
jgi:hypothetical protein